MKLDSLLLPLPSVGIPTLDDCAPMIVGDMLDPHLVSYPHGFRWGKWTFCAYCTLSYNNSFSFKHDFGMFYDTVRS